MKNSIYFFLMLMPVLANAQYLGSGAVTKGLATTTTSNLYTCTNGRVTDLGTISATNSSVWTVPAVVNFTNASFPFASNLYNPCTGALFANNAAALAALNGSDIVTVDPNGEIITAYVFTDNYFEMYINGTPVGKDNVPFTQFNSNIVRFRVNRPFTIAMLLVDWEEKLGVGCENNNGFLYHPGDGGLVAVFKDSLNYTIAKTGSDWKAQTFYTAPIMDLTCPSEFGNQRLSNNCSTQDSNDGTSYYGLHWSRPVNWMSETFNDSVFPQASIYTNATVRVDNKPAYTNFANIFDDVANDAQFIWSTNLVLDNEVIVRNTVSSSTGIFENENMENRIQLFPNPTKKEFQIAHDNSIKNSQIMLVSVYNSIGEKVFETNKYENKISLPMLPNGVFFVRVSFDHLLITKKLIIQ